MGIDGKANCSMPPTQGPWHREAERRRPRQPDFPRAERDGLHTADWVLARTMHE
jgi:hypothetical protein